MAFTKAPQVSTHDTIRVPFYSVMNQNRTAKVGDYGAQLVNVLPDVYTNPATGEKKYYLRTRPGIKCLEAGSKNTDWKAGTNAARGIFFWDGVGVFSVWGNKLYLGSTSIQTLSTSTGQVGFTLFLNSAGTTWLIVLDGTSGWRVTSGGVVTQITDVDFPTPHIATPVFMDGYLFVAKSNTQDIYNSNLDDPMTWTAGEFISAESNPDPLTAIIKNNQYIYAFSTQTIEIFYNAGNATGTPLARQQSKIYQFGIASHSHVCQAGEHMAFVAQDGTGRQKVLLLDGQKNTVEEISTAAALPLNLATYTTFSMFFLSMCHQKLLVINQGISDYGESATPNPTLVYSIDHKLWMMWRFKDKQGWNVARAAPATTGGTVYFQMIANPSVSTGSGLGFYSPTSDTTWGDFNGQDSYLDNSSGSWVESTENVQSLIVTDKLDFGTMNRKRINSLSLIVDPTFDNVSPEMTISVYWSDKDNKDTPTAKGPLTTEVYEASSNIYLYNPKIFQLGMTRKRTFAFAYSAANVMRFDAFEVEINKGQS